MITNNYKDAVACAVQFTPTWLSPVENGRRMAEYVERAADEGHAQLVVFPELSSAGYILKERDSVFGTKYYRAAEYIPSGPVTQALCKQAKKSRTYVVVGISEKHPVIPGVLYNSAALISPMGEVIGVHRKVHMPGYERFYFCAGSEMNVFKTELGNIGMSICYDNQFPELVRTLALKGMEIHCMLWNMPDFSNFPEHLYHITAVRALENRMYTISCNRPCPADSNGDITFIGASCISDPVGTIIAKAGQDEELIYAALSSEKFAADRFFQPVFKDRRPELYSSVTEKL